MPERAWGYPFPPLAIEKDEMPGTVDEVKNLIRERNLDGLMQKLRESGLEEQCRAEGSTCSQSWPRMGATPTQYRVAD